MPSHALAVERDLWELEREIERARLVGLRPGVRWLADNRPRPVEDTVVCHGDFHPLNVLVDQRACQRRHRLVGRRVRLGDPAYDVGATAALLAHGPVNVPDLLAGPINLGRRCFVAAYLELTCATGRSTASASATTRRSAASSSLSRRAPHARPRPASFPPILKRTAFGDERTVRGVVAALSCHHRDGASRRYPDVGR